MLGLIVLASTAGLVTLYLLHVSVFYGPVVLPYISNSISWIYILGYIVWADTVCDLILNIGQCDLYFKVHFFYQYILYCLMDLHHIGLMF